MSAEFYKKLGAQRIVLAREMTLAQIKELRKKTKIEIETFVHGAMCVAVSGRCILSPICLVNLLIVELALSHVEKNGFYQTLKEIKFLIMENIF
jgi:hypothetical protein